MATSGNSMATDRLHRATSLQQAATPWLQPETPVAPLQRCCRSLLGALAINADFLGSIHPLSDQSPILGED